MTCSTIKTTKTTLAEIIKILKHENIRYTITQENGEFVIKLPVDETTQCPITEDHIPTQQTMLHKFWGQEDD